MRKARQIRRTKRNEKYLSSLTRQVKWCLMKGAPSVLVEATGQTEREREEEGVVLIEREEEEMVLILE